MLKYYEQNERKNKHSYYSALASNLTHGGGGMVDRYMGWYGGYGMAYMRVLRCCIMWCVRQSHCRGSTVRLIVFALGLYDRMHKTHVEAFVAQT